jgi:hypothetical protein
LAGIVAPNDHSAGIGMVVCPSFLRDAHAAPEASSVMHILFLGVAVCCGLTGGLTPRSEDPEAAQEGHAGGVRDRSRLDERLDHGLTNVEL